MPGGSDWLSDEQYTLLQSLLMYLLTGALVLNGIWGGLRLIDHIVQLLRLIKANWQANTAREQAAIRKRMDTLGREFWQALQDLLKREGLKMGLVGTAAVALNQLNKVNADSAIKA